MVSVWSKMANDEYLEQNGKWWCSLLSERTESHCGADQLSSVFEKKIMWTGEILARKHGFSVRTRSAGGASIRIGRDPWRWAPGWCVDSVRIFGFPSRWIRILGWILKRANFSERKAGMVHFSESKTQEKCVRVGRHSSVCVYFAPYPLVRKLPFQVATLKARKKKLSKCYFDGKCFSWAVWHQSTRNLDTRWRRADPDCASAVSSLDIRSRPPYMLIFLRSPFKNHPPIIKSPPPIIKSIV